MDLQVASQLCRFPRLRKAIRLILGPVKLNQCIGDQCDMYERVEHEIQLVES